MSALSLLGVAALVTSGALGPEAFWSTAGTTPDETEIAAQLVGIWRSNASSSRPLANVSPESLDIQVWGDDEAAADVPGWLLAAVSLDAASGSDSDDWEDN